MPPKRRRRTGKGRPIALYIYCWACSGIVMAWERIYSKDDTLSSRTYARCTKGHRIVTTNNLSIQEVR